MLGPGHFFCLVHCITVSGNLRENHKCYWRTMGNWKHSRWKMRNRHRFVVGIYDKKKHLRRSRHSCKNNL